MFKAKLKAVYQDLTQSEKLVADYILDHIDEIHDYIAPAGCQYAYWPVHNHPFSQKAPATTASGDCWRICRRSRVRI